MCGIAGIVNLTPGMAPVTVERLTSMAAALRHRGSDEFGVFRDPVAGLAHARLSIIDIATGQQPMSNESGTLWVVFNGEIFNFLELRRELEAAGHRFRTSSDTEVIVHAYEEWGDDAFRRFNGQWAVALWDTVRRALVLARDPFGIQPLFLCHHRGRVYVASEVKAIFAADTAIPRAFDPVGLDQVFTFWTAVAPRTVFAGVEELPPGTTRTFVDGTTRDTRCYEPSYPGSDSEGFAGSLADASEAVAAALGKATSLRMLRADVGVGSYLSGGLDSSLIAALALEAKGESFCTFSLRFTDAEYDETRYQRLMAAHLGSDHREITVSRDDIAASFPEVIAHAERPLLRTAPAPLFLLSRLVRDAGIKVVLTGEGADEMFAGYDLFREAKVRRFWARQPQSNRRPLLLERLYPYLERSPVRQRAMAREFFGRHLDEWRAPGFGHQPRWRSTRALLRLMTPDMRAAAAQEDARAMLLAALPPRFAGWSWLAQDQYLETRTLLSGYLLSAQGDRMLMAHSVEGRFPFLDREVTALAESLPAAFKLRVLDEKHVLKRAFRGTIPDAILQRDKQPYRAPDALSFASAQAAGWIDAVADPSSLALAGVFDPAASRALLEKCRRQGGASGPFSNTDNMAVVGLLSTQLVYDQFIRHTPAANRSIRLTTLIDRVDAASNLSNTPAR